MVQAEAAPGGGDDVIGSTRRWTRIDRRHMGIRHRFPSGGIPMAGPTWTPFQTAEARAGRHPLRRCWMAVSAEPARAAAPESREARDAGSVRDASTRIVRKHHALVRLSHWLNVPVLLLLAASGLSIYWASPVFRHVPTHAAPRG